MMSNLPVPNTMNYNLPTSMGMGMSNPTGSNPNILGALKGIEINRS